MKTLIKPWKGLKQLAYGTGRASISGENPNKTLEGIKTGFEHPGILQYIQVKTLIKPWKGLKQFRQRTFFDARHGENPNKTLEGIKTIQQTIRSHRVRLM
ncbi:hypothetical protein U27_01419 [Candidatus Vecturithrix granuli]|uniref:Uncharacterized protein n=1 Tax=Vecturithrix granuli TaxID=1499967 RepID=A0A081CAB3_VECG1|nr:hypothetical protein U27_01419 [Candidatus Vecturithrix granuli]